jgi:hypothetical protein
MSDHRQGRSGEAGDRNGEDGRRVARLQSRQDFWVGPEEGGPRRRAHRRSRVQPVRRLRRST